ncbi:Tlg2-vesicle protein [Cryptotrichosporon argae]
MALKDMAKAWTDRALAPYRKMSKRSRTTFWVVFAAHILALVIILAITPRRIAVFFNDIALRLRASGVKGMLLMAAFVIVSSHPPLFGFSGSMTLIGFAFGIWPGFLIAALSANIGAALSFLSVRIFFLNWMRRFGSSKNEKWNAFGHVMRTKGWPLVAMIRWCPLPWAIGNGLFASIEGVKLWHFALANVLYLPRLLVPVFIGSRLESLIDRDASPDPLRFWLNMASIAASLAVSVGTGFWVYRLTLDQMRRSGGTGDVDDEEGELAAEALEQNALLGDYSGDEDDDEQLVPRALAPTQQTV